MKKVLYFVLLAFALSVFVPAVEAAPLSPVAAKAKTKAHKKKHRKHKKHRKQHKKKLAAAETILQREAV